MNKLNTLKSRITANTNHVVSLSNAERIKSHTTRTTGCLFEDRLIKICFHICTTANAFLLIYSINMKINIFDIV